MSETPAPAASPRLHFELVTLFPELFDSFLAQSLIGKAIASGLIAVSRTNLRDFGLGRHRAVDDSPYGGGPGMVLRPEPLAAAIDHIEAERGRAHRVLLSPQGRLFDQAAAATLATRGRVLLICGRYEGIDERVSSLYADEVLSVGDFVLCGGELAAAVVIEATARLCPGVIGKNESTVDESFSAGRLEYPQYTRPPEFRGLAVPEVLLSGDHAAIAAWRAEESLRRTEAVRPDLVTRHPLTPQEQQLAQRLPGKGPVSRPPKKRRDPGQEPGP
jgi:tRNA (guanine37-N1)-methyltransferase